MPRIWLRDKRGAAFHIIVETAAWTGDYNTPETAVPVPKSILSVNRNMNSITIGSINIVLDVNGREGSCKQCGQCCSHPVTSCPHPAGNCGYPLSGEYHKCPHLVLLGPGLGKRDGTSCDIHDSLLYDGLKGCVCFPSSKNEIAPHMTACAFRFP